MMMRRIQIIFLFIVLINITAQAQNVGLSFSYFIPKNGYFSTPISPFSIRGLGFDINRFIALQAGASLYRMPGLNIKGTPLVSKDPFVSNFTIFVPAELVFQLKGKGVQFDIKGGGFFFHGFGQRLNYGNIDRAVLKYEGWNVANANLSFKNKPGFGYHAGAELTIDVTQQLGVSIETNYLVGESRLPLTGTYAGGNSTIETEVVDFPDAKIDFTGLEFSIGLIFNSGGSGKGGYKPKRRRR